jgi:hypothetical protein
MSANSFVILGEFLSRTFFSSVLAYRRGDKIVLEKSS